MKKTLFIALMWLAQVASAQVVNLMRQRFHVSKTDFVDTIPLTIDRYNQILIPVTIGDSLHFFKLDTGSGFGTVYEGHRIQSVRRLGQVKSVDGAGHQTRVDVVQLPPFTIGSVEISDYVMTEAPASVLANAFGHDAVIGFALFAQGLSAKIDLQAQQLILTDRKRLFDAEPGLRMKYRLMHFAPHIDVSPQEGMHLDALFDTGSNALFSLSKRHLDQYGTQLQGAITDKAFGQIAIANHGLEQADEVAFMHFDSLRLADVRLFDVEARSHQGATSIGRSLLRHGSLVIKPSRRQMKFQPYGGGDAVRADEQLAAVYYVPEQQHAAVGLIRTSAALYKAGLRQADVILSVNDRVVDFVGYVNYPWVKNATYRLKVRGADGQERVVTFVRE